MEVKRTHFADNLSNDRFYYRFSWFHLTRPLTFTGTISPILAGTVLAAYNGSIRYDILLAMLTATLLIQAATNMFNDYFDFRSGQDQNKWVTANSNKPESGHGPAHHLIPYAAGSLLMLATIIGLWLALNSSFWIILIGIAGIAAGYAYSAGRHSFSSIGLGEAVAAIFLGLVPASLAYIIQGNSLSIQILAVAIPFALAIATMIFTNNLRDIEKDREFRSTVVIKMGKAKAVQFLTLLLGLTYLSIILLIIFQVTTWTTGLTLFTLPLAIRLRWSFRKNAKRTEEIAAMKLAAQHHWLLSFLFLIGMLFGL
ncbi:hypothetical protein CIL05_20265 [Virgibacillus profundi]|uniref:1,4-dihydroxy-2-naphthoate octaprenyltransferase n=1 Tax=Virgibacillus profundi TaxID=2024555 RepID=A0A2A2I9D7_9BACI|nr:prenyltransferase [Virgibacillus profundi]PAV27750.1 hypothetical protein CIL05_20265 [Virgibacillus profundi]PXY51905.1 prenyltransferase [Virgibacillus profundi]